MTAGGVVPALDKFKACDTGFGLNLEPLPVEQFAFECGEETLAHGVAKQSLTDPIEGRMLISLQCKPKSTEVYCDP